MARILWVGDGPQFPTGFAQVTRNVCGALHRAGHEVHVLAVHEDGGTPTKEYSYSIYPASSAGDLCGVSRVRKYVDFLQPDIVWLFSDLWVIFQYLERLQGVQASVCVYFPVDAKGLKAHPEWIQALRKTAFCATFTKFGADEVKRAGYPHEVHILPHGADGSVFYPCPNRERFKLQPDTFVVLNANRNQPRKRIDLTIEGFCLFIARNKETNAKLWLHMGVKDCGWDVMALYRQIATSYGLDLSKKYLHLTHAEKHHPNESLQTLAQIYSSADVMVNTSIGEGWGLVAHEGALCGTAQVVPENSASEEIWSGFGLTATCPSSFYDPETSLKYLVPSVQELADILGFLYHNPDERQQIAVRCAARAREFQWEPVCAKFVALATEPPAPIPDCVALNADHHRRMAEDAQARVGHCNAAIGARDAESRANLVGHLKTWGEKSAPKSPCRLLEVGAGFAGDRDYLLENLCDEYVGIEIVPEVAQKSGVINIALDDVPSTWHRRFDFVYSRHVMEHVPYPEFSLGQVFELLVPGGLVGAVTPHYFPDPEPAHLSQLTLEQWVELYLRVGFEICVAELQTYNCPEAHIVARRPL